MKALHKITMHVGLSILLGAIGGCAAAQPRAALPNHTINTYQALKLGGDQIKNGRADVSVEYDQDGVGWLAYSIVEIPSRVSTHLAKSVDNGATWNHVSVINPATPAKVQVGKKEIEGLWRNETPTLTYDPGDPGKEWKLFWHKYFVKSPFKDRDRLFNHGWIAYRHAPHPQGPWSEEIRLIGNQAVGAQFATKDMHPDLQNVLFLLEPGTIVENGVVYLCADTNTTDSGLGDWMNRRVILLASHDHCQTWSYVGTLSDGKDARNFGYAALTGTSLVRHGGSLYQLITPSGSSFKKNRGHDGTIVAKISDITKAELVRDAEGQIVPLKYLSPQHDMGGLSDYHELNYNGGVIMPQISLKSRPDLFQVISTREGILPEDLGGVKK